MRRPWADLVAEVTWQPMTELSVVPIPGPLEDRLKLVVKVLTLDTHTAEPTAILHEYELWPDSGEYADAMGLTLEGQLAYLKRCLRDVALHEADEWFKYQGKIVDNPHDRLPTG